MNSRGAAPWTSSRWMSSMEPSSITVRRCRSALATALETCASNTGRPSSEANTTPVRDRWIWVRSQQGLAAATCGVALFRDVPDRRSRARCATDRSAGALGGSGGGAVAAVARVDGPGCADASLRSALMRGPCQQANAAARLCRCPQNIPARAKCTWGSSAFRTGPARLSSCLGRVARSAHQTWRTCQWLSLPA
jgi:hypothetical protein